MPSVTAGGPCINGKSGSAELLALRGTSARLTVAWKDARDGPEAGRGRDASSSFKLLHAMLAWEQGLAPLAPLAPLAEVHERAADERVAQLEKKLAQKAPAAAGLFLSSPPSEESEVLNLMPKNVFAERESETVRSLPWPPWSTRSEACAARQS